MWVESVEGEGSTFSFTIEAGVGDEPAGSERAGPQPSLAGKRLLVVDDNATNRRILLLQSESWGMNARETALPREALAWIEAGAAFDLAILDMHMPELDGASLARAIRELRGDATPPLVLFSSLSGAGADLEPGLFAAVLTKPVKQSQLFNLLAAIFAAPGVPVAIRREEPRGRGADPELGRTHPLRLLVAEDNAVNQQLAILLLDGLGYCADLAANGLEALQMVERAPYDAILMDVQMPEMDGLKASRALCLRWPQEERPRIIAMTANAMQGDRETCLAAGMDDYLSKPIRVEELAAALRRTPAREIASITLAGRRAAPVTDESTESPAGTARVSPVAVPRAGETPAVPDPPAWVQSQSTATLSDCEAENPAPSVEARFTAPTNPPEEADSEDRSSATDQPRTEHDPPPSLPQTWEREGRGERGPSPTPAQSSVLSPHSSFLVGPRGGRAAASDDGEGAAGRPGVARADLPEQRPRAAEPDGAGPAIGPKRSPAAGGTHAQI